jgi:hypothetical protein
MGWLRRAVSVVFATAIAIGAGLIVLPVAAIIDPVTRTGSLDLIQFAAAALADAELADELYGSGLAALINFVWFAVMTICVLPVVAVALLGEIARVRALAWYAGATGVAAASAPWLIRTALHMPRAAEYNLAELRFALVFFFAGLVSGFIYWLLAGRDANQRPSH